jgi:hypothetical protein
MIQATKLYYKTKLAIVRDSEIGDAFALAPNMRESDKIEIWRSHHRTPESALVAGYTESTICLTIERNESPIAMFGICPQTILGNTATIWLLGSPEIEKIQRTFLKHSLYFIEMMLGYYPLLNNYVDIENRQSIRWLKWCRAEFGPIVPYGIEQQPFIYFQFRRS